MVLSPSNLKPCEHATIVHDVTSDLPSLPVYPVDYRFLTPSTGLPAGRTFLPFFHNIVQIFFSVVLSITFVRS